MDAAASRRLGPVRSRLIRRSLTLAITLSMAATSFGQIKASDEMTIRIVEARVAALMAADKEGKHLAPAEVDAVSAKLAASMLDNVDLTIVPTDSLLSWASVLSYAARHDEAIGLANRYLASKPSREQMFEAELVKMREFSADKKFEDALEQANTMHSYNLESKARAACASVYLLSDWMMQEKGVKAATDFIHGMVEVLPDKGDSEAADDWIRRGKRLGEAKVKQVAMLKDGVPELVVVNEIGDYTNMARYEGKVVLLDFFAHWCHPCIGAFPEVKGLRDEYGPKGLVVLGVTTFQGFYGADKAITEGDELGRMRDFVVQKHVEWPVVFVPQEQLTDFGAVEMPYTVLVDKCGKVRLMMAGSTEEVQEKIRVRVEALLEE